MIDWNSLSWQALAPITAFAAAKTVPHVTVITKCTTNLQDKILRCGYESAKLSRFVSSFLG